MYTHLVLVIDKSSSMSSMAKEASDGITNLLKEQKDLGPDFRTTVTLVEFNHSYRTVYDFRDVREITSRYRMWPNGLTALFDAVGFTIDSVGQHLSQLLAHERPDRVLFVIVTDGEENSSAQFTLKSIQEKVLHQKEKYGWEFLFLGADISAFSVGSQMGGMVAAQYNADKNGVTAMYSSLSKTVTTSMRNNQSLQETVKSNFSRENN